MSVLCPALQDLGVCPSLTTCTFNHDVVGNFCFDCGVLKTPGHDVSAPHKQAKIFRRLDTVCPICNVTVHRNIWAQHAGGVPHNRNVAQTGTRPSGPVMRRVLPAGIVASCEACCLDFVTAEGQIQHQRSAEHQDRVRLRHVGLVLWGVIRRDSAIQTTPNGATLNFNSAIEKSPGTPFVRTQVDVRVVGTAVQLVAAIISRGSRSLSMPFSFGTDRPELPLSMESSSVLSLGIYCSVGEVDGFSEGRLELKFRDADGTIFIIPYVLEALVPGVQSISHSTVAPTHSNDHPPAKLLRPVPQPVAVPEASTEDQQTRFIPAPGLEIFSTMRYLRKLKPYPLDKEFETPRSEDEQMQFAVSKLPESFNINTYGAHWQVLLNMEEAQTIKDLEMYTIYDTHLEKVKKLYYVAVPGLAEKRPSVLLGDVVHVSTSSNPDVQYGGRVVQVRDRDIAIHFKKQFKYKAGTPCEVRFTINRVTFRRMIQGACANSMPLLKALFPQPNHVSTLRSPSRKQTKSIQTINPAVAYNEEQLNVIAAVRLRPAGSPPFVIFGPPGTGKTVTVVESIRQLLRDPKNRILACAPSNAASDTLAERLLDLGPDVLFRLNAPSRHPNTLPAALVLFSYIDDQELFSVPPLATVKRYRVVVCTSMSAAVLHGIGINTGHFTHIFIDEAGQCSEPELMVGFKTLATTRTNLILSGDPKQLGPVVRSKVAGQFGLNRSFLDRLTELPMYDTVEGSGITIIKLLKNFRSHESILHFSNEAFYGNELQPSAPASATDRFLGSQELASPDFPVVFWGCDGPDERDDRSPSYLNRQEVSTIAELVDRLLHDTDYPLDGAGIGIISPYRAQVTELKQRLRSSYPDMKIGSTEEFQGQERDVIILSTVRSNESRIGHDLRHVLGFLANPRRMNVALTRAKALLVVVGNPRILGLDHLWREFLNFVHVKGGWKGVEPNWDTAAPIGYEDEAPVVSYTAQEEMDGIARGIQDHLENLGQWNTSAVAEEVQDYLVDASWGWNDE